MAYADPARRLRVHKFEDDALIGSHQEWRGFVGRDVAVLWEKQTAPDVWEGLTDTYQRVRASSSADLYNQIGIARVSGLGADGLEAEILP